jgi:Lipocalin-like domain
MKNMSLLSILCLFAAMATATGSAAPDDSSNGSVQGRFVGAWRLVSLEEPDAQGKIHKADCTGLLVYTRDGHMSLQVMYRNPGGESSRSPVQYTQGGYEASFGTYRIDDSHAFTFHIEGALVRTLVGKDLKRVFKLSGNQLIVNSPDPNEHWKVVWEHY